MLLHSKIYILVCLVVSCKLQLTFLLFVQDGLSSLRTLIDHNFDGTQAYALLAFENLVRLFVCMYVSSLFSPRVPVSSHILLTLTISLLQVDPASGLRERVLQDRDLLRYKHSFVTLCVYY